MAMCDGFLRFRGPHLRPGGAAQECTRGGGMMNLPSAFMTLEIRRATIKDIKELLPVCRQLVEEILRWLAQHRVTLVELTVAANNDAIPFWQRLGFHVYMHQMKKELESG